MNIESEPQGVSGLLSEEEAHEEANMIRLALDGREPTHEDYEMALREIEELKGLAEQDSTGVKFRDRIKELMEKSIDKLIFIGSFVPGSTVTSIALYFGEERLRDSANYERYMRGMLDGFDSATQKLRRLKEGSEYPAKKEVPSS